MNSTNNTTLKGHGFFRKSKKYGLVSAIALGIAVFGTNVVSADQVAPTDLSLIHISEPTRLHKVSRMPSSA